MIKLLIHPRLRNLPELPRLSNSVNGPSCFPAARLGWPETQIDGRGVEDRICCHRCVWKTRFTTSRKDSAEKLDRLSNTAGCRYNERVQNHDKTSGADESCGRFLFGHAGAASGIS